MFLFLNLSFSQQERKLDSLFEIWGNEKLSDSIRMKALDDYIWYGPLYSNPDVGIKYSDSLYVFARERNNKKVMSTALSLKGVAYWVKSDFKTSIKFHKQSLKIREAINDQLGVASSLTNIGINHKAEGNFLKALHFYNKALKTNLELGDKKKIANSYYNIGVIYSTKGDFLKAIDYQKRVLKISKEISDERGEILALNSIGDIYALKDDFRMALDYYNKVLTRIDQTGITERLSLIFGNMGTCYNSLNQYDKSIEYLDKALKLDKEKGNDRGVMYNLNSLGNVYKEQDDISKAIQCYNEALDISKNIGDPLGSVMTMNYLGNVYNLKGNYNKAIEICLKGYDMAQKIEVLKEQEGLCSCLYEAYKMKKDGINALMFHEKRLMLKDSLQKEETAKKLQQMEFEKQVLADSLLQVEKDLKVEMAHREEVRKKDRNKNIALASGVFLLFLSGGLYGRWRYVKKSKAIIEKEKDRSDNLLLNILPSEIAEELKVKGSADARDFDMVSILFTDFKGFTEISAKLSAKELINEINTCFKAFDHICESYGIEKIKTIGDAYMAAGGLPVPSEAAAKDTVLAALEMQKFIRDRHKEKSSKNEVAFKMRVGIHTGPVVAGIVGVKKFQYDIWGDTVNTASRMESSGAVDKVNISETTYKLLKDDADFVFESRGKVAAKGKGEIEMYFVSKP